MSVDGVNFIPLRPEGVQSQKFPCGRTYGYQSGTFKFPRSIVAENPGAVLQMEFDTDYGTIVQCADIIVQKVKPFLVQKCEPSCKNGGVCQNGVCKCSKMFEGPACETQVESSGSFSYILFIVLIALVIVGIVLINQNEKYQRNIREILDNQQRPGYN